MIAGGFEANGVRLAYWLAGSSDGWPIVLLHGFALNSELNWIQTGWADLLTRRGCRVVLLDQRGHGNSDKPHTPEDYDRTRMAHDVVSLMDHLEIGQFDCVAYSMGARVALEALALAHDRARRAVLIAVGSFAPGLLALAIAARLRGEQTDNPIVEAYCQFVRTVAGNDLEALACCVLAPHRTLGNDVSRIAADVMVMVGEHDDLRDEAQAIAANVPRGRFMILNGLNHNNIHLATRSKSAAVAFLEGRG